MRRTAAMLLTLVAALVVLGVADQQLRRASRLDETLLHGESGISWVDEFLAKRAAEQARLNELIAAAARASTTAEIFKANFALIEFETRVGRGDGRRVREALVAITTAGKDDPQTIAAWRERIRLAEADHIPPDLLVKNYAAAVHQLKHGENQLSRLFDLWRLAANHQVPKLERATLEEIYREYPNEPTALTAYETLAALYRQDGRTNELAGLEAAIHAALVRQRELGRPK